MLASEPSGSMHVPGASPGGAGHGFESLLCCGLTAGSGKLFESLQKGKLIYANQYMLTWVVHTGGSGSHSICWYNESRDTVFPLCLWRFPQNVTLRSHTVCVHAYTQVHKCVCTSVHICLWRSKDISGVLSGVSSTLWGLFTFVFLRHCFLLD